MTNPYDPNQQGQPPQDQPQQGGYLPPAPPVSDSEMRSVAVAKPKAVDTAFQLWIASVIVGLVANLISFATAQDVLNKTNEKLGTALQQSSPSYGSAIFSLVILALWVVLIFQMRGGANWARIVLTVLGGLSILAQLLGLLAIGILFSVGALGAIQALLGIVELIVVIGAIVFMFKGESSRYFKAS
ncbi:hypothetical protein F0L68_07135 [Solihabitans fulvus]|uniref:Uncharacterized protein n=1 Tax=Solihabitans fulvus TaxID=1892852 RepID=A0A5B2XNA2_9PSEU|nr:hypothetical protein [Solihabitans fulvus]KAA2264843.1 hypothetical protein F0L68_07135 [Solihabitans fulvus]